EFRDHSAVVALVVEPARLLAFAQIGEEPHTVLHELDRLLERAAQGSDLARQSLVLPRSAVVAQEDGLGREDLVDRLEEQRELRRRAGAVEVETEGIAEAVDDSARQAVGLAVDQAIAGNADEPIAQRERVAEALGEEAAVDRRIGIAVEQTRADQRGRV